MHLTTEIKLVCIVLGQTRPACATEDAEEVVIGLDLKKAMQRCVLVENMSRHAINKIVCDDKCLIQKRNGS